MDTADIREGPDVAERMGIERAAASARGADVVVMMMDVDEGWTENDGAVFNGLWKIGVELPSPAILVANKADKSGPSFLLRPICHLRCRRPRETALLTAHRLRDIRIHHPRQCLATRGTGGFEHSCDEDH